MDTVLSEINHHRGQIIPYYAQLVKRVDLKCFHHKKKGHKEILKVMDTSITLIVVMALQVRAHVPTHQIIYIKYFCI